MKTTGDLEEKCHSLLILTFLYTTISFELVSSSLQSEFRTQVSRSEFKLNLFILDPSLALGQSNHLQVAIFRLCTSSHLEAVDMI